MIKYCVGIAKVRQLKHKESYILLKKYILLLFTIAFCLLLLAKCAKLKLKNSVYYHESLSKLKIA